MSWLNPDQDEALAAILPRIPRLQSRRSAEQAAAEKLRLAEPVLVRITRSCHQAQHGHLEAGQIYTLTRAEALELEHCAAAVILTEEAA